MFELQVLDKERMWYTIGISELESEMILFAFQWHKQNDYYSFYRVKNSNTGLITTQFQIIF